MISTNQLIIYTSVQRTTTLLAWNWTAPLYDSCTSTPRSETRPRSCRLERSCN